MMIQWANKLFLGLLTLPRYFQYSVNEIQYDIKNFPFEGYKILQLSDLHLGYGLKPKFLVSLIEKVSHLNPDIVVITGDLIETDIESVLPALDVLKDMTTRYPTYFVLGNHDFQYNPPTVVLEILNSLGIKVLMNESVLIGTEDSGFHLAGVSDPITRIYELDKYYPDIERTLQDTRKESAIVLLSHRPIVRFCEKKHGIDLVLSGHIHGGQIFPFGMLSIWFKEDSGEKISVSDKSFDSCYLHVSKGLGFTTLPFRFLARSEISLITIGAK